MNKFKLSQIKYIASYFGNVTILGPTDDLPTNLIYNLYSHKLNLCQHENSYRFAVCLKMAAQKSKVGMGKTVHYVDFRYYVIKTC